LESVNLPEGLKKIGYQTFEDCTSLKNINIPDSITRIEQRAFAGCNNISDEAYQKIVRINPNAFND
jgi:hypothetical protein